ncbi:hypothetical protein Pcinc_038746 [Petrolisthes cinctipes]|uniref:Uncharacterized protein n=1 Tax=Petrolisthes cinctipes TaxID=88211 RepID=A0AAE1EL95_PETCI|nr:hypothetical protein Pcinc_038746 [Petrolisthes cinctipes]
MLSQPLPHPHPPSSPTHEPLPSTTLTTHHTTPPSPHNPPTFPSYITNTHLFLLLPRLPTTRPHPINYPPPSPPSLTPTSSFYYPDYPPHDPTPTPLSTPSPFSITYTHLFLLLHPSPPPQPWRLSGVLLKQELVQSPSKIVPTFLLLHTKLPVTWIFMVAIVEETMRILTLTMDSASWNCIFDYGFGI